MTTIRFMNDEARETWFSERLAGLNDAERAELDRRAADVMRPRRQWAAKWSDGQREHTFWAVAEVMERPELRELVCRLSQLPRPVLDVVDALTNSLHSAIHDEGAFRPDLEPQLAGIVASLLTTEEDARSAALEAFVAWRAEDRERDMAEQRRYILWDVAQGTAPPLGEAARELEEDPE